MKKLVAFVLVLIVLCTCIMSVGAYSPCLPGSDGYEKMKEIEKELTPLFAEHFSEQTNGETINWVSLLLIGTLNGEVEEEYRLISFGTNAAIEKEVSYRIGEYAVVSEYEFPVYIDGMAVYTPADECWHSLNYIYEKDAAEFWRIVYSYQTSAQVAVVTYFATGQDFFDIKIATMIQKLLAGIDVDVASEKVRFFDVDNDGDVTIKDATAVQKLIAGLDVYIHDSVV